MSRQKTVLALLGIVVLQLLLLTGMLAKASLPLWTGQEIRVRTVPVDPRSLFRGNYARLSYDFSQIPAGALPVDSLRQNEVVYVSLQKNENNTWQYQSASLEKPDSGVFLRGRLQSRHRGIDVRYGLEAWFAPKDKALELERELRDGGIAVLMVDSAGNAALKEILPLE